MGSFPLGIFSLSNALIMLVISTFTFHYLHLLCYSVIHHLFHLSPILLSVHMGNFNPVDWNESQELSKMMQHTDCYYHIFVVSHNFIAGEP